MHADNGAKWMTACWALCAWVWPGEADVPEPEYYLALTRQTNAAVVSWTPHPNTDYFIQYTSDLTDWRFDPLLSRAGTNPPPRPLQANQTAASFRLAAWPTADHEFVSGPANTALATQHIFYSDQIARPISYHIYLPDAYHTEPEAHFPVLYWLHGSGAGEIGIPPLCNLYDGAIQNEFIRPMIIVFPHGLPQGMWCDAKDGSTPMESILIHDLIPEIEARFRASTNRADRLIEGFSMGGYGAARIGLKHSDKFQALSLFGAGPLQLDFMSTEHTLVPLAKREQIFNQVYGADTNYFIAQSPWSLAETYADSDIDDLIIRQAVGVDDLILFHNRAFQERLVALNIPHQYTEVNDVGHQPMLLLLGLGPAHWTFYRQVLGPP